MDHSRRDTGLPSCMHYEEANYVESLDRVYIPSAGNGSISVLGAI
jgi:hypothetical protein